MRRRFYWYMGRTVSAVISFWELIRKLTPKIRCRFYDGAADLWIACRRDLDASQCQDTSESDLRSPHVHGASRLRQGVVRVVWFSGVGEHSGIMT